MAQKSTQTIRTTFNKGLLTEFSELNFPQEASIDELNCDLFRSGYRAKRYGIEVQEGTEPFEVSVESGSLFHIQKWTNVGEDPTVNFIVVQAKGFLYFFKQGEVPLINNVQSVSASDSNVYELDMSTYTVPGSSGAGFSKISTASINGDLIVVSPQLNPFVVYRDPDTKEFSHEPIDFYIRDFEWLGDRTEYTREEESPDIYRKYDTKNCGWADGPNGVGDAALQTYVGGGVETFDSGGVSDANWEERGL